MNVLFVDEVDWLKKVVFEVHNLSFMSQKMKNYYDAYAEYYDENRLSEILLCYTSKKEKEKPSKFLQKRTCACTYRSSFI